MSLERGKDESCKWEIERVSTRVGRMVSRVQEMRDVSTPFRAFWRGTNGKRALGRLVIKLSLITVQGDDQLNVVKEISAQDRSSL